MTSNFEKKNKNIVVTKTMYIPSGWECVSFGDISNICNKRLEPNNTTALKCVELEHIEQKTGRLFGFTTSKSKTSSKAVFKKGNVLFGKLRPYLKKYWIADFDGICSTEFLIFTNKKKTTSEYIFYTIQTDSFLDNSISKSFGTKMPRTNWKIVKEYQLSLPPLPEQKKIAAILTSVDNTIESTRKVIEQTKRVKQGLLQELLTKGIGHTKFKKTVIGEIPEEWEVMDYGSLVEVEMPPIEMKDDDYYAPTIVRRRNNGIETRETKKGKHILVKNQYKTVPGTFLISRRQIIHRACGIVPEGLSNAIISKEYLALKAKKKKLDIRYLYFHSLTHIFQLTIIRTTYGVDDEKFVFKDKWWMKEKMPLPPLKEQKKIIDIFLSIDKKIIKTEKELNQLQQLKKGLMQDLLSGTVRVKV
jgi:type I restriction enzyme S subunit